MAKKVYCRVTEKGIHSFYLECDGEKYFLFSQDYKKSTHLYFKSGLYIENALPRSDSSTSVTKTLEKLPSYIKYIEKEYGIAVFNKTYQKTKKYCKIYNRALENRIAYYEAV